LKYFKNFFNKLQKNEPAHPQIILKYFQKFQNAGDQFSHAAAKKYFSQNITPGNYKKNEEANLVLLGSILQWADEHSIVCGAGFISKDAKLKEKPKSIICVRGPITASMLEIQGIAPPNLLADPGILAPDLFPEKHETIHKIGIIPHYWDFTSPWIEHCRNKGFFIIDVLSPLEIFFKQLQQCEVIISSSLHGIIFAHAYNKPAVWVEISDKVAGDGFKFFDYYQSIGFEPDKIIRLNITNKPDANPIEIASKATMGDHSTLKPVLEEAISISKRSLNLQL